MADTEAEEAPTLPGGCTAEMLHEGVRSLLKSDSWDTLTCARHSRCLRLVLQAMQLSAPHALTHAG